MSAEQHGMISDVTEGEPPITAGDGGGQQPGGIRRWLGRRAHDAADVGGDGCSDGCDFDGCDGCDGCSGCDLGLVVLVQALFVGRHPQGRGRQRPGPVDLPAAMAADPTLPVGTRWVLALLRVYKHLLSPRIPAVCRYTPSCSGYAAEAVRRHGPRRGLRLAYRRVRRCNPSGGRGYDPVREG